jgi:hypothetical protein
MINEILHFLGLLDLDRTGREPDRPLEQQCVNHFLNTIPRAEDAGHMLVGSGFFLVRALPFLQVPNFKAAAVAHERHFALQPERAAHVFREDEAALPV